MKLNRVHLVALASAAAMALLPVAGWCQLPPGRTLTLSAPRPLKSVALPSQPLSYPYPWNQPYGGIPGTNPYAAVGPQVVFPYAPTPSALPMAPAPSYNPPPDRFHYGHRFWNDGYDYVPGYPYYSAYPNYPVYPDYSSYPPATYAPTYNIYYPTIYQNYQNYQAAPSASTGAGDSAAPQAGSDGSGAWYPYNYDPYSSSPEPQDSAPAAPSASKPKQLIPVALASSLQDIAGSWKTGDEQSLGRHLSSGGRVLIRMDGKYVGSTQSSDYASMTAAELRSVKTTDFKYTDVHLLPSGDAVAYAVQQYRTSPDAVSPMYLSYSLDRSSETGAYTLVAVDTSTAPLPQTD